MRWRRFGPIAGLAVAALLAAFFLLRETGVPIGAANGSYEHDCCGTLRLDGGVMLVGESKKVRYSLEQDEAGAYLLPATYVGPWEERGFEIDGTRPALKLRLDRVPGPTRIALTDGRSVYVLKRKRFRVPKRPG